MSEEKVLRQNLYSIYDEACKEFGPLFQAVNDQVAIRQHKMMLLKVQPEFRNEFKLYFMGWIDATSGKITTTGVPALVRVDLAEVKEAK